MSEQAPWQISIDTGGTFTDCLAVDPAGTTHRAKVLSNGALRGRIIERIGRRQLRIEHSWNAPDDFVRGFEFIPLDDPSITTTVEQFDASESLLLLNDPLTASLPADAAFELKCEDEAPILAARLVTATTPDAALPPLDMRLATTRGTNALLQHRGGPVALFVTEGFGDLLAIGDQQRPDLFALNIEKPTPLPKTVVEVPERLAADGTVIRELDLEYVRRAIRPPLDSGITCAAVALAHSYLNRDHEQRLAAMLRAEGFGHISCSSDLAPLIKLLPRAETAVVNAYLSPVLENYLKNIQQTINQSPTSLRLMTSGGGLVSHANFSPKDSLLSGPAGGVAGAAATGRAAGYEKIISFDMGGTSTDVARYDGDFQYVFEHCVGDARLLAPALAIETVAAGGGSICAVDDKRLTVGPDSAGAFPGPACYGAGGPLTLTDINLLMGRLDPDGFEIPIDRNAARTRLESIAHVVGACNDPETLLDGFLEIANERMADAIARISLRRGYDPARYALVAFGGAGGQHACAVADQLGITGVVFPPDAPLLSAVGLQRAVIERIVQRQVLAPLEKVESQLQSLLEQMGQEATAQVAAEDIDPERITIRRRIANLRLAGQESTIAVEIDESPRLSERFDSRYRSMYGHGPGEKAIEVESVRVIASEEVQNEKEKSTHAKSRAVEAVRTERVRFSGHLLETQMFARERLQPGDSITGPALIFERHSALVIEPGWEGGVDDNHAIVLQRCADADPAADIQSQTEAARLELFTSRFESIASQMSEMLRRTAVSTNVKERLDYSCALLDGDGELVANAPNIPVHLGAMSLCVQAVRDAVPMKPGDVLVTNHPAFGGTHLPDVTVMTPVFVAEDNNLTVGMPDSPDCEMKAGETPAPPTPAPPTPAPPTPAPPTPTPLGYVASRAHHAEIGGARPGSTPPDATTLAEEGVTIEPTLLIASGQSRFDELRQLLLENPHPTRAVDDNLADLRAAVAANRQGAVQLRDLAQQHGCQTVTHYMHELKQRSERLCRQAIAVLPGDELKATEYLDDGSPIQVRMTRQKNDLQIDFTGSADCHHGNLNATRAIVRSAIAYVLRLLVAEPIPLNEGLLAPIQITLPTGMLNPDFNPDPTRCPAVGCGNTETSQRLVDTLLKALNVAACSQGTMNNVLFGNDRFGYYETVCGGAGAGPKYAGADAVHTHMTNTRMTDTEIIEHRYPVRVQRFELRRESGGSGTHRGGDGVIREIQFLESLLLSIISQHRTHGPYGLGGGEAGKPGSQRIESSSGTVTQLSSIAGCEVGSQDRLILETPGGGGWGFTTEGRRESLEK